MRSAAREAYPPLSGDDLPIVNAEHFAVVEAAPSPPPGAERDVLVALNEQQALLAEQAVNTALEAYLDRLIGVVRSRLTGPRARKGTRWWSPTGKSPEIKTALVPAATMETKALDADYIVPDRLVEEVEEVLRPVALRVALDAGADTARRLGMRDPVGRGDSMFAIDQLDIERAVEDVITELLGGARRHAAEIRREILAADSSADSLDEVLDRVEQAHRKGGNWLRLSGRTLANALRNEAAIRAAMALGCTHMQWVSRRDERVRASHRHVDGTVRRIDDEFQVGAWRLRFPADPADLPASASVVFGCRCGLKFRKPDPEVREALRLLNRQQGGAYPDTVPRLLRQAAKAPAVQVPAGAPPAPDASVVTLTKPIVGYRVLDQVIPAVPGQRLLWRGEALALALAAPAFTAAAPVLAVAIPAGAVVTMVGGSVALLEGTPVEVVGTTPEATQARVVSET